MIESYKITKTVALRSVLDSPAEASDLERLWKYFKPNESLDGLISKQWGELGFQGKDPCTDFRGVGLLGLDCLLFFGENQDFSVLDKILAESVDGGVGWYPFALASISMTK